LAIRQYRYSGRENLGVYNPFRVGTRLYLTLPNGERVGFTFQPQRQEIPGLVYYTPAWVADTGVNYTLQSQDALLSLAGERLYELKTGQPYNPTTVGAQALHPVPSFTLTAPDGTIYHLDATGKVQAQIAANRVKLTYSDSGIISPSGELVSFIQDAEGRLSQISAPDGRIITYKYDAQGNLINARNLALAQSNYYSYAADHRLTLVAAANQPGATISYNIPQPQVTTLTGNLGSAFQFNPTVTQGEFKTGEIQRYSFSVRQSEVNSTATGIVLLGVEVKGNNIEPNLPVIQSLTPLSSQLNSNSAFSLFAVDQEGLNLLEVQGKTGNYSLQMFVAGDVNQDGLVDGVDGQLLTASLGRKVGEVGYSLNLDVNRDGTINATDVQILGSNFGFKANQAPVVKTTSLLTHEDLQVTVPLINLAEDLEGDEVFYRVLNPVNGTVGMTPNGKGAIFAPNADYTGTASFELIADDGFSSSQPVKVTVNVSDAPLINLDIQNRNPILEKGERTQLVFIGDFADQEDVIIPGNYLTLTSNNPIAATINTNGQVLGLGLADGTGIITASRNNLQAVTAFNVGIPTEGLDQALLILGLETFPQTLALAGQGDTRQLQVNFAGNIDVSSAEDRTQYFVSHPDIVSVSPDGLVTGLKTGETTITVINGAAEVVIPVKVENPVIGPAIIGKDGGIVQGNNGALVNIGSEILTEDVNVSIEPVTLANLPFSVPEPFNFLGAFELNIGERELAQPLQLAVPVVPGIPESKQVYFFRSGSLIDETGAERPAWYQVSQGIVGRDGFARTITPLSLGIDQTGTYLVADAPEDTIAEIQADFYSPFPVPDGYRLTVFVDPNQNTFSRSFAPRAAARLANDTEVQAASIIPASFSFGFSPVVAWEMAAAAVAGVVATSSFIKIGLPRGGDIKMLSVPPVGLPTTTRLNVQLNPNATNRLTFNIPPSPNLADQYLPAINSGEVNYNAQGTEILLLGDRFRTTLPDGIESVEVNFRDPRGNVISVTPGYSTEGSLRVIVPQTVVLGLSDINITRTLRPQRGQPQVFTSNSIQIAGKGGYVFASASRSPDQTSSERNQVVVINPKAPNNQTEIVAKIPISSNGVFLRPWGIATTPDLTRAYVTLRNGTIALIDAQTFQQVDINPSTSAIDAIALPTGAIPEQMTISPDGSYLFATDERTGTIYTVGINPNSRFYHSVQTFAIDGANFGLQGMTVSQDGKLLYVGVPQGGKRDTKPSSIVGVNIDPTSDDWGEVVVAPIAVQGNISSIITTPDPNKFIISNFNRDGRGIGILENRNIRYIDLTIGDRNDYFDVNTAAGLAFLPAHLSGFSHDYLFVAGKNAPPSDEFVTTTEYRFIPGVPFLLEYSKLANESIDQYHPYNPGGGSIGIIQDPFNVSTTKLIAATRPIPTSFPESVVLSADGRQLFANFKNPGSVFAFDVGQMIRTIEANSLSGRLERTPINDLNTAIDIKADYRKLNPVTREPYPSNVSEFRQPPVFGVAVGREDHAPLTINGYPYQLAVQTENWLQLESPMTNSEGDSTPEFTWKYINGVTERDIDEIKVYVSVFPRNQGLFPGGGIINTSFEEDAIIARTVGLEGIADDGNPNRILTATWSRETNQWIIRGDERLTGTTTRLTLPDSRELTAGQTYYWAVAATRNDGQKSTKFGEFKTAPIQLNTPFNGVTIITHGFQLGLSLGDESLANIPQSFVDMGNYVSKAGGGDGTVFAYNRSTGRWVSQSGQDATQATLGKPLVLVTDWAKESDIINSGFSEAAADSFFASLMQLNQELGNKILQSPLHFIGHSRGTVVNSEMIQRLGTYFPSVSVQMTTLDPHDFNQPSLDVPLESLIGGLLVRKLAGKVADIALRNIADSLQKFIQKQFIKKTLQEGLSNILPDLQQLGVLNFSDFQDPDVLRWENVAVADNYYQKVAGESANDITFTPNGRSIPGADIDVQLDGRTGFTSDNLIGGTHSRVWQWYGGTINLNLSNFSDLDKFPIFRKIGDRGRIGTDNINAPVLTFSGVPWYASQYVSRQIPPYTVDFSQYSVNASWEGIGEGWFYSKLGSTNRPSQVTGGISVSTNNTEVPSNAPAVPVIFNGDFEYGNLSAVRFPIPSNEIPGWSFHGGFSGIGQQREITSGSGDVVYSDSSEGTGRIAQENGNHFLVLSNAFSENSLTHNRFYIPTENIAPELSFKYWIKRSSRDDILKVSLISSLSEEVSLSILPTTITNNWALSSFVLPNTFRGKIAQLTINLFDSNGNPIESTIWIDDVTLNSFVAPFSINNLNLNESLSLRANQTDFNATSQELLTSLVNTSLNFVDENLLTAASNSIDLPIVASSSLISLNTDFSDNITFTVNASPTLLNPNFSISNPNDSQFGWTTQGAATVSNGIATLSENSPNNARFSQTFLIPDNATTLQFTILNANLGATSLTPPDAFEVALLNTNTLTPLVGTPSGLNNTDAFLNLQKNGQIYLSPKVSLNSLTPSNSPITVSVDLTGIAAGTAATLYFDLLGFGQRDASVSIDNVLLLTDNPNLPPTSLNDSITTPEDTSITIPVLNNDTDDGTLDPTSLAIISNPSQGQIQLNPDGTITYTPKPNFNGTDTFSYTVKDDIGQTSNSATVTVTVTPVNDLPTLTNDSITLNQGSSVTFSVLSNDTDIDGTIDATTLAIATNPTHGQLQLNPDATFTYTPNPNFSGTDTFTYTVKDNGGQISQPATVTLTVNNLPPTITNLIGDTQIKEGDQAGFQAIATDPGNDTLSYSWNFGDGSNPVTGQSVNHKFADNGSYVVTLTVTDTFGASTSQNLNVNVANVAPTVNAGSDRTATQGTAVTLAGNFTDPGILDTHSLTWDFGDGTTASNTLTPTHIYTTPGDYTVTLTVTDKDGAIISDTLNLSVTPTTELPTVAINDVTIKEKDGITSARFTVTLSQASNQAITVNFNTSDGTAKAGIDYLSRQGQISFAAGETSKTLEITLKTRKRGDIDGDGDIDRDDLNLIVAGRNTSARSPQPNQKTFFLNLGDITGATLLDNQGTGILLSDGLDPRDLDGDGLITVLDARILAVLMRS